MNISQQFSSQFFRFKHIIDHVATECLSNTRALQLTQGVIGCTANDQLKIKARM